MTNIIRTKLCIKDKEKVNRLEETKYGNQCKVCEDLRIKSDAKTFSVHILIFFASDQHDGAVIGISSPNYECLFSR